jgi:hypothetical protein
MSSEKPMSDLKCREEALAAVRDARAALQRVPAAALDGGKHETLQELVDGSESLERALTNEVSQLREGGGDGE